MLTPPTGAQSARLSARYFVAGFTLWELLLVICVAGTIATVAAGRFLYWEERAEQAAFQAVLAGMKMGLQMRMAEMILTNQQAQVGSLEADNPVRWLEEPPGNYAGEYTPPTRSGRWYYAPPEHALVYVPSCNSYLDTGKSGVKELWFRIVVRYEMSAVTGGQVPAGIGLVPMRAFSWF